MPLNNNNSQRFINFSGNGKKSNGKKFLPSIFTKVLEFYKEPQSPSVVCKFLGISKQRMNYYVRKGYKMGFLEKQKQGKIVLYKLTPLGLQFLKDSKTDGKKVLDTYEENQRLVKSIRVHHLVVKFPIEIDNPNLKAGKENELRNWSERYLKIHGLRVTLKKTTKHIVAYFHEIHFPANLNFIANLTVYLAKYFNAIRELLWQRYRILIDIGKAQVVSQHIANYIPILNEIAKKTMTKQTTIRVYLGRKALSVTGPMEEEAYAEIDFSKFKITGIPELETDDLLYEEKLLLMPEKIFEFDKMAKFIIQQQYEFAKNIKLHMEVMKEMKETLKQIRNSLEKVAKGGETDEK